MSIDFFLLAGSAALIGPAMAAAQDVAPASSVTRPDVQPKIDPSAVPVGPDGQHPPANLGEIVVTGKPRGSVRGDIPPENVLDRADLRATGASDINAILDVLAPQLGSGRGRDENPPVLLLDGQRISSGRELRDIPTEAIARLEILPEEVGLTYGYRADQRVVNIVLVDAFSSLAILIGGSAATDGGYADGTANFTRLIIGDDARTTIYLSVEGNSLLTENERDIRVGRSPEAGSDQSGAARSLIGSKRDVRAALTHYRRFGDVGVSGNLELGQRRRRSLIGLGETSVVPLVRDTTEDAVHAGVVANGNAARWFWSVTANADVSRNTIDTDRDAGGRDRVVSSIASGDLDVVVNGPMFSVPAGETGVTFRIGGSALNLEGRRRLNVSDLSTELNRSRVESSISFDLPVSRRHSGFGGLGNLTLNGNAKVERISNFKSLTTFGAGAYWSPAPRLNFIASWTSEGGAPTLQQLGELPVETPLTRLFDATTGTTALATVITGGNPGLKADRRNVVKFGGYWKPFENTDLRLRADYVQSRFTRPISTLYGPTPAFEAAFPERFIRNQAGQLVRADLRPLNFDSGRRDTFRMGIDFSLPLNRTARSTNAVGDVQSEMTAGLNAIEGEGTPVRTLFGPNDGNRLWFSLTDTVTLVDDAVIRGGLKLDYLRGDAAGIDGGRARHDIDGRVGYSVNGRGGVVLSANWRSGTHVTTASGQDVRFAPLAKFNLGLFVNLDPRFNFVAKHPWLEGASIHLEVKNLFNARPNARDRFGNAPLGFQPDVLDPIGRMIGITFRKGGGGAGG